jgi:hypothetical protein
MLSHVATATAAESLGGNAWIQPIAQLIVLYILITAAIVFVTRAQRRIPIQQGRQMRGRRVYGGQRHYLPLKVNQAGVMPIIFASFLFIVPTVMDKVFGTTWWQSAFRWGGFWYILFYSALVFVFSFFWTSLMFQPKDRGQPQGVRRLRARPAAGRPHGRVPRARHVPRHARGRRLPGRHRGAAAGAVQQRAQHAGRDGGVPGRHVHPHRGGRGAGPGRQGELHAGHAPLRGPRRQRRRLGALGRQAAWRRIVRGRAGLPAGHAGQAPPARASRTSPPATLRAAVAWAAPRVKAAKAHMDAGRLVPDDVVFGVLFEPSTRTPGFVLDGFRAWRRPRGWTGASPRCARRSRPVDIEVPDAARRAAPGRRGVRRLQPTTTWILPPRNGACDDAAARRAARTTSRRW